ncbi:MAG: erythromycin esterase family protein [Pirellulaceae bacterium]
MTTGAHLRRELGDSYRVLATAFANGTYLGLAKEDPELDVIVETHQPRPGCIEHLLLAFAQSASMPNYWIDLRSQRERRQQGAFRKRSA